MREEYDFSNGKRGAVLKGPVDPAVMAQLQAIEREFELQAFDKLDAKLRAIGKLEAETRREVAALRLREKERREQIELFIQAPLSGFPADDAYYKAMTVKLDRARFEAVKLWGLTQDKSTQQIMVEALDQLLRETARSSH